MTRDELKRIFDEATKNPQLQDDPEINLILLDEGSKALREQCNFVSLLEDAALHNPSRTALRLYATFANSFAQNVRAFQAIFPNALDEIEEATQ